MGEIVNIAELGVAGMAVFFLYRITSNHLHHLTSSVDRLAEAFQDLIDHLKS